MDQAMAQNLIFFRERERQRLQPPGSNAVSALMSALSGGVPAAPPPRLPPVLQQQPPVASQSTEEMAMDMGTDQGDEQMTDGAGVQQSGSQGLMEDPNVT